MGEGETKSFSLAQEVLRTSGKPYYEKFNADLSGTMRMHIFLWFMRGKGAECITGISVKNKPDAMSMAQLKSRAISMTANNSLCVYHNHLPFELRGEKSIKAGKGGFAVTDIQVVFTEEVRMQRSDGTSEGCISMPSLLMYGWSS